MIVVFLLLLDPAASAKKNNGASRVDITEYSERLSTVTPATRFLDLVVRSVLDHENSAPWKLRTLEQILDNRTNAVSHQVLQNVLDESGDLGKQGRGCSPRNPMSVACPNGVLLARRAVESVLTNQVPGDVVECGVFRGGTAAVMQATLLAYSEGLPERRLWLVDSFQGIPAFDQGLDTTGKRWAGQYAAGKSTVLSNFRQLGLLAPNIRLVAGFFQNTLPAKLPAREIAVLRFDGDTYESTKAVFEAIYDKVVEGGYVLIDDWHVPDCRRALRELGHTEAIEIQGLGRFGSKYKNAYWRKGHDVRGEPCLVDHCRIARI